MVCASSKTLPIPYRLPSAAGGSAIPVAVGQAIQDKLKLPVLEVYGMTETSSVHTTAYPERPIRLGSAGLPMPYSRVRIVKLDAGGKYQRDCAADEIGVVTAECGAAREFDADHVDGLGAFA